jgi:Spy/CpxP family protein refolding chaperone
MPDRDDPLSEEFLKKMESDGLDKDQVQELLKLTPEQRQRLGDLLTARKEMRSKIN